MATDRDLSLLPAVWNGRAHEGVLQLDVADETQCVTAVAASIGMPGGLDGVFNSAGISDVVSPATDIEIDDWQRIVDVNLRGSF